MQTSAKNNVLFANLLLTCFALALLSTALNTALPQVCLDLAVPVHQGQLVISGYILALAALMPLSAYLATRFPTRPLYCTAVGLFALSTAAAALAPNFSMLMTARLLQAFANALVATLTQSIILSQFPVNQRGKRMGWFGFTQGTAPLIAPVFGGVVADALGWRYVFASIMTLALISFILSLAVARNALPHRPKPFDVPGFVLSAVAVAGLTQGLAGLANFNSNSQLALWCLAAGAAATLAYALRQRRQRDPLLKLGILGKGQFRCAAIASMAAYFVFMGASITLPLHLQMAAGASASASGLVVLPGAICMALASPLAGKVLDKHGVKPLAVASSALALCGCLGMILATEAQCLAAYALAHLLICSAFAIVQMPLATWGNACLEKQDLPHGTALLTLLRNMGGSLGVAACASVMHSGGTADAFAVMAAIGLLTLAPVAHKHEA